jgi:hypothetical protein
VVTMFPCIRSRSDEWIKRLKIYDVLDIINVLKKISMRKEFDVYLRFMAEGSGLD